MAKRKGQRTGWKDTPAAGDLAALVGCEREYVHRVTRGDRPTARRQAAAEAGEIEHRMAELAMQAHHNQHPQRTPERDNSSMTDKRCFIATAVYGPDAEPTHQLRRFRDRALMPSFAGRCLVRAYYALSPSLARLLLRHPRCRAVVRPVLDAARRLRWIRGNAW